MNCPICDSTEKEEWRGAGLTKCLNCGHIWQTTVEKTVDYGKEYVEKGYVKRNVPTNSMAWVRAAFLWLFAQKGRVLDVGYGDGEFVRVACKAGFDAWGFDVHAEEIEGVRTVRRLERGFDVVTLFDSLEHFHFLTHIFVTMPRLFIVTVPHVAADMTEEKIIGWRHYKPDEHLHYFSPDSITRLFARFGYGLTKSVCLEDIIRKNPDANPNTMTYVFERE